MDIYCCSCDCKIKARLTTGVEIYPHREDLFDLPFWKCDTCGNFVGCHHKTDNRTHPLGVIPTPELKKARQEIHKILDPLWKGGGMKRNKVYKLISGRVGWKYHTAKIRSIEEARDVYRIVRDLANKKPLATGVTRG
ncbi:MAG: hypothetical protein GY941_12115 [Planctomycetes bacterium]|nr:hypothetical protein [Planctomycetota bacterium]